MYYACESCGDTFETYVGAFDREPEACELCGSSYIYETDAPDDEEEDSGCGDCDGCSECSERNVA